MAITATIVRFICTLPVSSPISLLISRFKRACAPRFDDDIKSYDVTRLMPVNGVCFVNRHACGGMSINIRSINEAVNACCGSAI